MNIYIDESGTINNSLRHTPFVIALIHVHDKKHLKKAYKRFVSSRYDRLKELDVEKIDPKTGCITRPGGRMFSGDNFQELKACEFDKSMKLDFVDFFSRNHYFDIYYIKVDNSKISNNFCKNNTRSFNYLLRLALCYFIQKGFLPKEDCQLQLDDRSRKPESKYFLEDYLNTELTVSGVLPVSFTVEYFDSINNCIIQIADVFSNLYYSNLETNAYASTIQKLKDQGILKAIFEFPPQEK